MKTILLFLTVFLVGALATFEIAPLSYNYDALEPVIDARTMEIHYSKHYQAYLDKLNAALQTPVAQRETPAMASLLELFQFLPMLPEPLATQVINQGGGVYNHGLFWTIMSPMEDEQSHEKGMSDALRAAIDSEFESLEGLIAKFSEAALNKFGSGWAWLMVRSSDGKLGISTTSNQQNPLMKGVVSNEDAGIPILGLDVWEHAYYLQYQNKRKDYVDNFWKIINWTQVSMNYNMARKGKVAALPNRLPPPRDEL